jgi:hypothetical protein
MQSARALTTFPAKVKQSIDQNEIIRIGDSFKTVYRGLAGINLAMTLLVKTPNFMPKSESTGTAERTVPLR